MTELAKGGWELYREQQEKARGTREEEMKREELRREYEGWVQLKCAYCNGTGYHPFPSVCPACYKRGYIQIRKPYGPCPNCRGTGRNAALLSCARCGGKGVIHVEPPGFEMQPLAEGEEIPEEELRRLYEEEGRPVWEIAWRYQRSASVIAACMRRYGIEPREAVYARKMRPF